MGISSERRSSADNTGSLHRARLLIGRAICWFTDPVNDERRHAISLPDVPAKPAAVIPDPVDPAHLPIFSNGRRPPFFYDVPVRDRLIGCLHRMTLDQARELCIAEFGAERTPSRSAIANFWRKPDRHAAGTANPALRGRFKAPHRTRSLGNRAAGTKNQTERQS